MKKGYARQHPGAAIVFVGKGETSRRGILPKPLVVDQKNLITEVSNFTFPFNWQTPMMKGKIHSILNVQQYEKIEIYISYLLLSVAIRNLLHTTTNILVVQIPFKNLS